MSFKQLKTLLWRNIILKKRGRFFTILEIIIPIIIIGIIAKYSRFEEIPETIETIKNIRNVSLELPTYFSEKILHTIMT